MSVKHNNCFISKINKDDADILGEIFREYATNSQREGDRAKNVFYDVPDIGTVQISHSTGSILFFTNFDEIYIKKKLKDFLGKRAYIMFEVNFRRVEIGLHYVKWHGTTGLTLDVSKPSKIPIWISVRSCKNYADVHFGIKTKDASIIDSLNMREREINNPSIHTKMHYLKDEEIICFIKKKGIVCPSDGKELGISRSQLYRRLEGIVDRNKKIKRTSGYPAIYSYVG